MENKLRVQLLITGRVQGVGYRAWGCQMAMNLGLAGWIKNLADGSVAALLEGSEDAVRQMIALCHTGPRSSQVTQVSVIEQKYIGDLAGVTIQR